MKRRTKVTTAIGTIIGGDGVSAVAIASLLHSRRGASTSRTPAMRKRCLMRVKRPFATTRSAARPSGVMHSRLPTSSVQEVGSYPEYASRAPGVVVKAGHDPAPTFAQAQSCSVRNQNSLRSSASG